MKKILISIMIKLIKKDFGASCVDYDEGCTSCWANESIAFLKHYKSLL